MNRRGLLGSLGRLAALGGAATLAGCTSPTEPSGPATAPRSPEATDSGADGLTVADFGDVEGDDGELIVRVTVENPTGERRSGTVVVTATAGDEEDTASADATVDPGSRVEVDVSTSLSYDAFTRDGSLRVEVN
ncbi:hypothetical protein Hbl1158_10430 [Halobaculum sp. CBA1158]|uniref:hypothetical protein n=1 Tax=Halobaculum sp. CBA1158 TaxID=2904243 RepID=UPI001F23B7AF|nr:hypothetical protein [Halobaculum sp. CBA1158]UIO98951.1 hypothetical protein Hbl1158_10430 [Halobaculum sp. CBA1158]